MKRIPIAVGLSALFASTAFAGRPSPQDTTCPIGGEVFETTSTMSCTTMGATLLLRSLTSCDFVTKLPVCPGNKLPMYKTFTDADKAEITVLMESPAYKTSISNDKFYRAYLIDTQLSSADVKAQYFSLQNGIWYGNPEQTLNNPEYMLAYHNAANKYLDSVKTEDDAPFYMGAQAFAYFLSDQKIAAIVKFAQAKSLAKSENAYRDTYFKALENCFAGKVDAELCTANTPIRAHDPKNKR